MNKTNSKKLFDLILNEVYNNLIEKLKNDAYTNGFIKNKEFEKLTILFKNVLDENFELFLENKIDNFKQNIIVFTRKFDNFGMDYSVYLESINFLELSFLKTIFENIENFSFCKLEDFFIKINNYFNLIRNYSALSFLEDCIDREKFLLSEYILRAIKENDKELFNYINYYLNLTDDFLDFIKSENLEFNERIHIKNIKHRIFSIKKKEEIKDFLKLLENINKIIEQIIALKKEKNYLLLIEKYNEFMKHSLMFLSFIITNLTVMEIKKLQLDPLTKTFTRSNLENLILGIEDFSIISNKPFAIAFIDIDNFKSVNDTYGHLAGDEVLKNIAKIIKSKIRLSDYLFRYGGEEFFIVFSTIKNIETLKEKLEEIRKSIEYTYVDVGNGKKINVTVSIGGLFIRLFKREPVKNLIEKADELMYQAKRSGKNRVIVEEYCRMQ
jgi:diguanylate cyclase (GGDEF)-like protein